MKLRKTTISIKFQTLLPELLILAFLCIAVYYLAEKPKVDLQAKKTQVKAQALSEVNRYRVKSEKIMNRNLFAMDGKYEGTVTSVPEEPYKLIAVVIGNEKKAILRDFTGQTITAKHNDVLIDGFVLVEIKENSVVLKRGATTKELFIFKQTRK